MTRTALVVGGSSGLGLEIALKLAEEYSVVVTGRKNPNKRGIIFRYLPLDGDAYQLHTSFSALLRDIGEIDLCLYSAGFYQEGTIDQLSLADIKKMVSVGLLAPTILLERLLNIQGKVEGVIMVTSTSQWTPRKLEPVYTATKAGLGMLAHSISLDERVGKVLVAGPAGMSTAFWRGDPSKDMSQMLDPAWVAESILTQYQGTYHYKFVKILRSPPRVEVAEIE